MIVQKKPSWDTFLLEIFYVNQKMHFFGGPTLPPQGQFFDSAPTGGTKPTPQYVFLHADSIFNVFT